MAQPCLRNPRRGYLSVTDVAWPSSHSCLNVAIFAWLFYLLVLSLPDIGTLLAHTLGDDVGCAVHTKLRLLKNAAMPAAIPTIPKPIIMYDPI